MDVWRHGAVCGQAEGVVQVGDLDVRAYRRDWAWLAGTPRMDRCGNTAATRPIIWARHIAGVGYVEVHTVKSPMVGPATSRRRGWWQGRQGGAIVQIGGGKDPLLLGGSFSPPEAINAYDGCDHQSKDGYHKQQNIIYNSLWNEKNFRIMLFYFNKTILSRNQYLQYTLLICSYLRFLVNSCQLFLHTLHNYVTDSGSALSHYQWSGPEWHV